MKYKTGIIRIRDNNSCEIIKLSNENIDQLLLFITKEKPIEEISFTSIQLTYSISNFITKIGYIISNFITKIGYFIMLIKLNMGNYIYKLLEFSSNITFLDICE